jgi:O-antigen/teichoic acid export membrane protein
VIERSAESETRGYGRSAGLLTVVFGVAGLLVYVYFAIASHTLDADQYGEVVVTWSAVYVISLTLFRPTEQLLARTLAERGVAWSVLRVAAAIQLALGAAAVALVLALHGPIADHLLSGDPTAYAVLLAALAGFGAAYYARGFFAGTRRFGFYAALLIVENGVRVGFAIAYASGLTDDSDVVLIGIAAAPVASLVVVPFVLLGEAAKADPGPGGDGPEFTLTHGGGFAAAVLVMMFSEQIIVSSGVLFVRVAENAQAAGKVFNILLVARAPLVLFQAIAASLLPHLTRLRARGDESGAEAFRVSMRTTIQAIAGFAAAVTLGVLAIGPQVMQLAFGDQFTYDRLGLAIVAVGMGFYLCAATLNQAALAQGQARRAAVCWAASALLFVIVNLLPGVDEIRRVEIGFTSVAILLCGLLYGLYRSPHPRGADSLEPGSPREIEARLAAADEIG